jgi:hypothetical protein
VPQTTAPARLPAPHDTHGYSLLVLRSPEHGYDSVYVSLLPVWEREKERGLSGKYPPNFLGELDASAV